MSEIILEDLSCSATGLQSLGAFARSLDTAEDKTISVDCRLVKSIDPNLAAAISALSERTWSKGQIIDFRRLRPRIRAKLSQNGLFGPPVSTSPSNCIPLKSFGLDGAKDFAAYTSLQFGRFDLPMMSSRVKQKIFEGMDELFNNAVIHSKSKGRIHVCGELFDDSGLLDFTIVELGVGFREPIGKYLGIPISAKHAIEWAMKEGNTTRGLDIPGGLGLKILKEFIDLNGGKFIVYSDAAYWCTHRGRVESAPVKMPFPGTLINLEININDPSSYRLKGEADPNALL